MRLPAAAIARGRCATCLERRELHVLQVHHASAARTPVDGPAGMLAGRCLWCCLIEESHGMSLGTACVQDVSMTQPALRSRAAISATLGLMGNCRCGSIATIFSALVDRWTSLGGGGGGERMKSPSTGDVGTP